MESSVFSSVSAAPGGPAIRLPLGALVVLVGPAGSGKSTWAARHFQPTQVVSSDACRGMIADDVTDQTASRDAFRLLYFIVGERLRRGLLTVVDSTALQPSMRAELLKIAAQHGSPTVAILFALPQEINEQWNASRKYRVPADVLERHRKNLDLSLRVLPTERFNTIYTLDSLEAITGTRVILGGLVPERAEPPFDIIGDVHGCYDELAALFERLGYRWREAEQDFAHPDGRLPVFVGDLADRGPASVAVLTLVERMAARGAALVVQVNHDNKLLRWLLGHRVQVRHGLATTIAQLEALPQEEQAALRPRLITLLQSASSYLMLDAGRLVVTHAGIRDEMIGHWSRAIQAFCLYGDVAGAHAETGLPVRLDWAASRAEEQAAAGPFIVYGHNVVEEAREVRRTLDIDTGCVFGGSLTALRYPEMELVQVSAARNYYHAEKAEAAATPEKATS